MNPSRLKPNLKTAQLLFEPVPPSEKRSTHHECPMMRRRVQSAKPRITTSHAEKREEKLSYLEVKFIESSARPKSAVTNFERFNRHSTEINQKTQRNSNFKPQNTTVKVFLPNTDNVNLQPASFGLKKGSPFYEKTKSDEQAKNYPYKLDSGAQAFQKEITVARKTPVVPTSRIPAGVARLSEWILEDVNEDICGVTAQDCLVFLPCLRLQEDTLTEVPPPQDCLDEQKCKLISPPTKPYDPKELFHYDVTKHIPNDHVCSHAKQGQIYGIDGKIMHDARHYGDSRSCNIIHKEIQDLEKLLQGIGNEDGCAVVQYQNEINKLQTQIKKTFEMCDELRAAHGMEESQVADMFGFQQFSHEHEMVMSQIRARREVCVEELSKLEASLGMTFQNELVQTYQHL